MDLPDSALTMARWFGSAIVGYAALSWFARDLPPSDGLRVIVMSLAVAWAVLGLMGLYAVLTGRVNVLGWSNVALDLGLSALLGWHLPPKRVSTPSATA